MIIKIFRTIKQWYDRLSPLLKSVFRLPLYLSFPTVVIIVQFISSLPNPAVERIDIILWSYSVFLFIWAWDFGATFLLYKLRGTKTEKKLKKEVNWHNYPTITFLINLYTLIWLCFMVVSIVRTYVPDITPYLSRQPHLLTPTLVLLTVIAVTIRIFF